MNQNDAPDFYGSYLTSKQTQNYELKTLLKRREYFLKYHLAKMLPDNKESKILDIGSGQGLVLKTIENLGYPNVFGVELSEECVKKSFFHDDEAKVIRADLLEFLERAGNENEKWDVVLAIDILEHFTKSQIEKILTLLKKIAQENATLIIQIPNAQSPLFAGTATMGDYTHQTHFTPQSIKQLLCVFNFKEVRCYEAYPAPTRFGGFIRFCLWFIIRAGFNILYSIETGELGKANVWTRSFLVLAKFS